MIRTQPYGGRLLLTDVARIEPVAMALAGCSIGEAMPAKDAAVLPPKDAWEWSLSSRPVEKLAARTCHVREDTAPELFVLCVR